MVRKGMGSEAAVRKWEWESKLSLPKRKKKEIGAKVRALRKEDNVEVEIQKCLEALQN